MLGEDDWVEVGTFENKINSLAPEKQIKVNIIENCGHMSVFENAEGITKCMSKWFCQTKNEKYEYRSAKNLDLINRCNEINIDGLKNKNQIGEIEISEDQGYITITQVTEESYIGAQKFDQ